MSKSLHHQIVARARELISDPERWTQRELAVTKIGTPVEPSDHFADRFCAVGALTRAASELTGDVFAADGLAYDAHMALLTFAEITPGTTTLECINDARHGHSAALNLFDDYLANSGHLPRTTTSQQT
jgi:hypothetical protein